MRRLLFFLLLGFACSSLPNGSARFANAKGAWRDSSGRTMNIESDRILTRENGELMIRGFVREEPPGTWVLRNQGRIERWHAAFERGALKLDRGTFTRLGVVPADLQLEPMKLPPPTPLDAVRIKAISDEILARMERDQAARKEHRDSKSVDVDNLQWLTSVVKEIGWIDPTRFGQRISAQALIMAKHNGSRGLPLVLGALPVIERQSHGQSFEILWDGTQFQLGRRQRYGTQVLTDANGDPYIGALEDPAHVDELRKAQGDYPLQQYAETISKVLYNGRPVRIITTDE